MLKEVFKVTNKDGVEVEYAVTMPNAQQLQEANIHSRKIFANALKQGVMLRSVLEKYMREQNIWGDEQEKEDFELRKEIAIRVNVLEKGGKNVKLSDAKKMALEVKDLRNKLRNLLSEKSSLDSNTVEGQVDNARFEFLVSECTVYNLDGKRYFKDLDDYYNKNLDPVSLIAASKLMQMMYSIESDYEQNLPENQFLKKFKFVDDKLRLVNKEGHLIDDDGRLINEDGRYVNENGDFVDIFGNLVNKDGHVVVDEPPVFLDDDGSPVVAT